MSRRVSLNMRMSHEDHSSAEVYVALFMIEHPEMDAPLRLSTDPTERLSDEPLTYGTRSAWSTQNPIEDPYLFILASTNLPSDLEDAPASGNLILENVDRRMAEVLRSVNTQGTIHMAVVLASSPDQVEVEYRDMRILSADMNAGEITVNFSRQPVEEEYYPADRMTKQRFPGMHK